MPAPPSFQGKPADSPIFYIAMSSPTCRCRWSNEYAETQLSAIDFASVAQVQIYGSQKFAVRVRATPTS